MRFSVYEGDKEFRYSLGNKGLKKLFVMGLNPSTANQSESDLTISRVERFASNWGFDGFVMLNLLSLRETDPRKLPSVIGTSKHSKNAEHIFKLFELEKEPVVWAAWGNLFDTRKYFPHLLGSIVEKCGSKIIWKHSGSITKKVNPRHPSRLSYQEKLKDFDMVEYLRFKEYDRDFQLEKD